MDHLVATEDTDNNYQITIEDGGPKVGDVIWEFSMVRV